MALTKITKADLESAIKKLTTSDASVWWKVLATTDEGTDLCFVVGWEYYDEDDRFYQDKGYTICAKIGYKPHNLMVMDYDDIYMPFDKKTGDVWDTDSAVDKDPSYWDMLVRNYNSEASAIWRKYGKPNRDGMSALDLMESKKKEAKKHTCSMQKKKESLTKMQEMHQMFKNWNPRNQAQVNNTLRLAMAECPQDMPELIKIVKAKGFDVPSGLTPATGWGSFESRSKRQYKECSMSKKKESLAKKNEAYSDYDAIQDWLEGVMEKAGTMFDSAHVSENRPGEICAEIYGYDSTGGDATFTLVWHAEEDFAETISAMADELVEFADDFDPEEEAKLYSNSGLVGVPSLRQLLDAMDERKEDMVSFAGAVSLAASKL